MTATLSSVRNKPEIDVTAQYAGIIGERPSRGARSPSLWNAVFEAEGIDCRFHPFDVDADGLADAVAELKADRRFVGGSVTAPYKSMILPFIDEVEPLAGKIGAVNALYRRDGRIVGANTDGEAALNCLRAALGAATISDRHVVVIGAGGAGMAVAAYIADDLSGNGRLTLLNRNVDQARQIAEDLGERVTAADFSSSSQYISGADIVVNCTSLGFDDGAATARPERAMTPLGPTDDLARNLAGTVDLIAASKPTALFYDIVYQPRSTVLLNLARAYGRTVMNGLAMNQGQAVIAFCKTISPGPDAVRVEQIMSAVP